MIQNQGELDINVTWLNDTATAFYLGWPGVESVLLQPSEPTAPYAVLVENLELPLTKNGVAAIRLKWTQVGSSYTIAQDYGDGWTPIAGTFPTTKKNYTIDFVLNEDGILIVGTIDIEIELPS